MEKSKNGIVLYYDILEQLKDFSNEEFGCFVRAIIDYDRNGTLPNEFDDKMKVAFNFVRRQLDENKNKYIEKCNKNRQNIKNYWDKKDTNVNERKRTYTMATDKDKDKDKDNDKDNDKELYNKQKIWFNNCFNIYPRKDNKLIALNVFCNKVKTKEYAQQVYQQVKEYVIAEDDTEIIYIKFFDNWLMANVEDEV